MTKTFYERRALAKAFRSELNRMHHCLFEAGYLLEVDLIVRAWIDYSESLCAGWLMLPDEDTALLSILLKHLAITQARHKRTNAFTARIVDAGDGSGDGILELPDELLASLGWGEGDLLSYEIRDSGSFCLTRIDDDSRTDAK